MIHNKTFTKTLPNGGDARVDFAADANKVEVGGGRDRHVCTGDEEEDGSVPFEYTCTSTAMMPRRRRTGFMYTFSLG